MKTVERHVDAIDDSGNHHVLVRTIALDESGNEVPCPATGLPSVRLARTGAYLTRLSSCQYSDVNGRTYTTGGTA